MSPQRRTRRSDAPRSEEWPETFSGAQRWPWCASGQPRPHPGGRARPGGGPGGAAAGRQHYWQEAVLSALAVLDEATSEADNADRPDSLLSDIARTQPRLRNRVRGVRLQYRQLQDAFGVLRQELDEHSGAASDFSDTRRRLGWLLTSLRRQQRP